MFVSFIAVIKRMVLSEAKSISRSEIHEVRFAISVQIFRPGKGAFQQSLVSNALESTVLRYLQFVNRERIPLRDPDWGFHKRLLCECGECAPVLAHYALGRRHYATMVGIFGCFGMLGIDGRGGSRRRSDVILIDRVFHGLIVLHLFRPFRLGPSIYMANFSKDNHPLLY